MSIADTDRPDGRKRKDGKPVMLPVLERASRVVGGTQRLADIIGITRSILYHWDEVPEDYVVPIERAQRAALKERKGEFVDRHEMRPDLYPKKK